MEGAAVRVLELFKHDVEMPEHVNLALVIRGDDLSETGQRHTGFVVRDFLGKYWLFHLGYNNGYRRNPISQHYNYLLIPILEPETETAIMAFLILLLQETKGDVPYSIAWEENKDYFNDEGQLVDMSLSDGFTCATFVLEVLKRYGLDLVCRATWPIPVEGSQDHNWQDEIVNNPNLGLSPDQFTAQVLRIGKHPRFRPEQALGAAHYYRGKRLNHAEVVPAGHEVLAEMARLRA